MLECLVSVCRSSEVKDGAGVEVGIVRVSSLTVDQGSQGLKLGLLVFNLGRLSLKEGPDLSCNRGEIRFVGEDGVVDGRLNLF